MNKWIAEFELEDGDTMPEHMDLEYKGAKIDFHCKPLEQEPCEDAISRQSMLDYLKYLHGEMPEEEFVKALPSVTPARKKEKWIPCSERMPEDGELVLFSTNTDRVYEGRFFVDNTDFQWYAFRDEAFAYNNVVTAWLPLPKPYKAESEDK